MHKANNFKICESKYLASLRGTVTRAIHTKTGAELVHISCSDERENFFAACFRTTPEDDKGIPHILEHIVLEGSKKYPMANAFLEVMKTSMATMLGGATWGDRTVYPCGSLNDEDFLNLTDFLMDAVFHPLLKEESFLKEGYRLEFRESGNPDSDLIHTGIVYNEMKGIENSDDGEVFRKTYQCLFPEGSCGKLSGGESRSIPSSTYKEIKDFHEKYYHPANSILFMLTHLPFEEIASFLDERLSEPAASNPEAHEVLQKKFTEPVAISAPVPGDEKTDCTVMSAWVVNPAGDPVETLALSLLEDILLSDDSSPIKKTLMDSKMGVGLFPWIYNPEDIQKSFYIGLKGVKREQANDVFELIHHSLRVCSEEGLDCTLVNNMLHLKELQMRRMDSNWPFSLTSLICRAWTHRENINHNLDFDYQFKTLRTRIEQNPRYLEEMISTYFIENTHRVDGLFYPDLKFIEKSENQVKNNLTELKQSLTAEEVENVIRQSKRLALHLKEPVTKEELAMLPRLSLSSIPIVQPVLHTEESIKGKPLLSTPMYTADLCYVDLCFDVSNLPMKLFPHLPFFADFITKTGADNKSYLEMAERELLCSGGIQATLTSTTSTVSSTKEYRVILRISGHCLSGDLADMLSLMRTRIFSTELHNQSRVLAVASELTERNRSFLNYKGNVLASLMAQSGLSVGAYISNLLHGIPAYKHISGINKNTVSNEVKALIEIHRYLCKNASQMLAWTGPQKHYEEVKSWFANLPGNDEGCTNQALHNVPSTPISSGITIQGGTAFAAASLLSIPLLHPLAASGMVMIKMLSLGYLWDEIISKNAGYSIKGFLKDGKVSFSSYRDPSPAASIQVFREAGMSGIEKIDLNSRSIENAIIASYKDFESPVRSTQANQIAIERYLKNMDSCYFNKNRTNLLEVNENSIREFAELLAKSAQNMHTCVMADADILTSMGIENRISV